jgi:hypothetical protein
MATQYIVKQGDYLVKIARSFGFIDYRIIWDDPQNAELKKKRGTPNILFPGDRLFVPDKSAKQEPGSTEQKHRFQLKSQNLMLRIVVKNHEDQPIANTPCELKVESTAKQLVTDGGGEVEEKLSPQDNDGQLSIVELKIPLKIGHLDPVEEVSGQQARLNNLGYHAGDIDKPDEMQRRSAIEEFQCDQKLKVDGVCGPKTQDKLKEVHGC